MPSGATLALFVGAVLVVMLTPGPGVVYVVVRSVAQGRVAGLVSAWGVGVGAQVQVVLGALGLAGVLAASEGAFVAVKLAGAAFLVWLGVQTVRARPRTAAVGGVVPRVPLGTVFAQAVVVSVLNPKTALFVVAFVPQFVDATRGPVALQLLLLGTLMSGIGVLADSGYALLAGTAAGALRRQAGWARAQAWVAGSVYVALGVLAALARVG